MTFPRKRFLTTILLLVACLLVGVAVGVLITPRCPEVVVLHDDMRRVTCWVSGTSVSCWPDWILRGP